MSEQKHTPGPWIVALRTFTMEGGRVYGFNVRSRARVLAEVEGVQLGEDECVARNLRESDANLIAAAPEMLDALDAIGSADQMPGHVDYLTKARMAEVARAALAKAKGGAS